MLQNALSECKYALSFASAQSSVSFLILDSYMRWSTSFLSPDVCVGFSMFFFVLLMFGFGVNKSMDFVYGSKTS